MEPLQFKVTQFLALLAKGSYQYGQLPPPAINGFSIQVFNHSFRSDLVLSRYLKMSLYKFLVLLILFLQWVGSSEVFVNLTTTRFVTY